MGGRGSASKVGGAGGIASANQAQNSQLPRSLENFDALQSAWEAQHFGAFTDIEKAYLREQFLKVFESNDFYMNFDSAILESIINGGFKNQFEVGNSGGALFNSRDLTPNNGRVEAAIQLFGVNWRRMTAADYEKYGSMMTHDLAKAKSQSPMGYGDVLARFKKANLIHRTTYTMDDSLGMGTVAGKVSRGDFTAFSEWNIHGRSDLLDRVRQSESLVGDARQWARKVNPGSAYLELQYHGKLTMHDVDSLVFEAHRQPPPRAVLDRLKTEFGISVYSYERRTNRLKKL